MIRQMSTMRIAADKEKEQRHEIPLFRAVPMLVTGNKEELMAVIGIGTRIWS